MNASAVIRPRGTDADGSRWSHPGLHIGFGQEGWKGWWLSLWLPTAPASGGHTLRQMLYWRPVDRRAVA